MRKNERPCVYGGCINRPPPKCFVWLHWCPFSSAAPKPAAATALPPAVLPLSLRDSCLINWSQMLDQRLSAIQSQTTFPFGLFQCHNRSMTLFREINAICVFLINSLQLTLCSLCQFFVCSYFATTLPTALRAFEILLAVDRFSNFYKLLTASAAFISSSQLLQMLLAVDSCGCF